MSSQDSLVGWWSLCVRGLFFLLPAVAMWAFIGWWSLLPCAAFWVIVIIVIGRVQAHGRP
jgi:hypothetical protein